MSDSKQNKVITIDGPAASGKSSLSALLAKKLGFLCLHSGKIYRSFACLVLENNVSPTKKSDIKRLLESCLCDFKNINGVAHFTFNGKAFCNEEINDEKTAAIVPIVAKHSSVRHLANKLQRKCASFFDIVCEGRDAGTVVFPNAELKIYLYADSSVRERRRTLQGSNEDLHKRDHHDSSRKKAPLRKAKDAYIIDTSTKNLKESVNIALKEAKNRGIF